MSSSILSFRCPFCREAVVVPRYRELFFTLLTLPGERMQRVVEVDGVEVHRCAFVRERYETAAWESMNRPATEARHLRLVSG